MKLQKKILNKLHFVLGPLARLYMSKPRWYSHWGIKVLVLPTVFHPGLFFSTKILLRYLRGKFTIKGKTVLELGAGSGLISIYCAKNGAEVTSSDINKLAIEGIIKNAQINDVKINIIKSDLFDEIGHATYDIIVINPPFYPKQVISEQDYAWFCGEGFDYFKKLFKQLSIFLKPDSTVIMILSEECKISEIKAIAAANGLAMEIIYSEMVWGGENYIFDIKRNQPT